MRGVNECLAALRCACRGFAQGDAAATAMTRSLTSGAEAPLPHAAIGMAPALQAFRPAASGNPSIWADRAVPSAAGAFIAGQQRRDATFGAADAQAPQPRRRPGVPGVSAPPPMLPGIVHIQSTRNNTILTLTDEAGNTKAWCALQ